MHRWRQGFDGTRAHFKILEGRVTARQGGEGSIWLHLVAIAVLGRSPMRPKTAIAARWRQIEPSLLKLSVFTLNTF